MLLAGLSGFRVRGHFEIVGPERGDWQAIVAEQVADRVIGPGISYRDRGCDLVAGDFDLVFALDYAFGPMPDLVCAAHRKPGELGLVKRPQAAPKTVQRDHHLRTSYLHASKLGASVRKIHPVIFSQRPAYQTRGHVMLVSWMDILALTQVNDDGLPGIRELHGFGL